MRRIITAMALALVVALAGVTVADSDQPKAAAATTVAADAVRTDEFLLLHDGDSVRVLFRRDAGPGSIRFLSLSDQSRLDILHPIVVAEKYSFRKEDGWQTYPHDVGWQIVTIILRETGDNVPTVELPGCSDVALRIENAAIISPYHTDVGGAGLRCEVCNAALDWRQDTAGVPGPKSEESR